jgi:hypothetical protein
VQERKIVENLHTNGGFYGGGYVVIENIARHQRKHWAQPLAAKRQDVPYRLVKIARLSGQIHILNFVLNEGAKFVESFHYYMLKFWDFVGCEASGIGYDADVHSGGFE